MEGQGKVQKRFPNLFLGFKIFGSLFLSSSQELCSACFHPFCFSKELRKGWEDAILHFKSTFDHAYDTGVVFETPKVLLIPC